MVHVRVLWGAVGIIDSHTELSEEVFCELVACCEFEGTRVHDDFAADVEVFNCVELVIVGGGAWNTVTLDKSTCQNKFAL